MRLDKHRQWVGAVYAEDMFLLREMLQEDTSLVDSLHAEFDDPYRESSYPVSTLLFAVAGPPAQQLDWRHIERPVNLELVELLLRAGANPNIDCSHGLPICYARDQKLAELLIRHGADINRWTDNGGSPVFFSVWNADPERLRMQLELGADINKADPRTGESALHVACLQVPASPEQEESLLEVVKLLIEAGIDLEGRTRSHVDTFAMEGGPPLHQDTPLHLAAGFGTERLVRLLVTRGADTKSRSGIGETPRDIALRCRRPDSLLEVL